MEVNSQEKKKEETIPSTQQNKSEENTSTQSNNLTTKEENTTVNTNTIDNNNTINNNTENNQKIEQNTTTTTTTTTTPQNEQPKIEEKKEEPPKEMTGVQRIRSKQTNPPTIPVGKLFSVGIFPLGEIQEYEGGNSFRKTSKEMREKERLFFNTYNIAREAAEVHRQVRAFAHQIIKPGIKLYDMCEQIENLNRKLVQEKGLERGIAFPTGCSLNHIAAHFSPNPQDKDVVFGYDDVMKVDFGVQINGTIIDCAWTVAPNPKFKILLDTVKEATNTGIKHAGIDARLNEIGEAIQEVMEAGEIELNGKVHPIRSVRNLNGHNIGPYRIHGGKSVPIIRGTEQIKMEEGEFYAIETFGSTGKGFVREDYDCSHYMKNFDAPFATLRSAGAKKLLHHINKNYSTLCFCKRWLERDGLEKYAGSLKQLCDVGIVNAYPPLCDIKGSYVAQYEHTILLKPTCKEVLSRGDDY